MKDWDPESRAGSCLLDDGQPLEFSGDAVQVRALRLGQRVQLRVEDGRVTALTITTLPLR